MELVKVVIMMKHSNNCIGSLGSMMAESNEPDHD